MEDIEKKTTDAGTEESGIDFGAMWQSVKRHKKLYLKVCGVAFVIALCLCLQPAVTLYV